MEHDFKFSSKKYIYNRMEKLRNIKFFNSSRIACASIAVTGIISLSILKKMVSKYQSRKATKRYNQMRDQKLQEMKEGYEKLKQLHPR